MSIAQVALEATVKTLQQLGENDEHVDYILWKNTLYIKKNNLFKLQKFKKSTVIKHKFLKQSGKA